LRNAQPDTLQPPLPGRRIACPPEPVTVAAFSSMMTLAGKDSSEISRGSIGDTSLNECRVPSAMQR
jgi:hypothetical protein